MRVGEAGGRIIRTEMRSQRKNGMNANVPIAMGLSFLMASQIESTAAESVM